MISQRPEPKLKRLYLVNIMHDVLVNERNYFILSDRHAEGSVRQRNVEQLRSPLEALLELAACGSDGAEVQTVPRLLTMTEIWQNKHVFTQEQAEQMQKRVLMAKGVSWQATLAKLAAEEASSKSEEIYPSSDETIGLLPERHGVHDNSNAPWHQLPAANGLYMKRKYGYPLRAKAMPKGGFKVPNGGKNSAYAFSRATQTDYQQGDKPIRSCGPRRRVSTTKSYAATTSTPTRMRFKTWTH